MRCKSSKSHQLELKEDNVGGSYSVCSVCRYNIESEVGELIMSKYDTEKIGEIGYYRFVQELLAE